MKYFILLVTTCVTVTSYAQSTFHITGQLIGKDTGAIVLWYTDAHDNGISDTVLLNQGKFSFSGNMRGATEGLIWTDLQNKDLDAPSLIRFILEPRNITVTKTMGDAPATITGSYAQAEKEIHDAHKASLTKGDQFRRQLADMDIAYLAKHPQSYVAAYLLDRRTRWMSVDSVMKFYAALTDSVRNSSLGYRVLQYVYPLTDDLAFRRKYPLIDHTFTEKLATIRSIHDFSLNDSSGKSVQFARFKGKYLLIEAWASWCKPCVQNIPVWNALVKHYDPERIQFVTVSMDREVDNWKQALRKHSPAGTTLIDTTSFKGLFAVYGKVLWWQDL